MGAAASIQHLYKNAMKWFMVYMDEEMYVQDFQSIDKDVDGGVSFGEMQHWIKEKASKHPDSCWTIFQANSVTLNVAHKAAAAHFDSKSSVVAKKVVDIIEFRSFLIHLFAVSMLWRHFSFVNAWQDGDIASYHQEMASKKLDFDEFKVAVRSFCFCLRPRRDFRR